MPAASTKPAPLALGARDIDGGNRVEMLGRAGQKPANDWNVDQLLTEFARDVVAGQRASGHWTPAPAFPSAAAPAPPREPSETEQLRSRVADLETRIKALEAANQIRNDGAGRLNQRVLAVLEQLVAELRERR